VVSKQAVTLVAVAIAMLVVGLGIGYGVAGTRVVTVTSYTTATFYTPITTTVTVREAVTMYTITTVPTTVTVTVTTTPTPTQKVAEAVLRQVVQAGSWRLAVLDVKEATYIKTPVFGTWSYYRAPEGMKIVVITLRIENTGAESRHLFGFAELSLPILVTATNKSYSKAYTYELQYVYEVSKEVEEKAVTYRELDVFAKVAPGSYVEGDIMFLITQDEKPAKLLLEYWPSPFEPKTIIIINLS
jgi:Telomeric repeat-binding factor 2.